ncbi:MAG: hypothetical protein COB08_011715 [Rhodobacteraceae bacterium]|nr:hypothetical protein [Paracoccaceae bacterium]
MSIFSCASLYITAVVFELGRVTNAAAAADFELERTVNADAAVDFELERADLNWPVLESRAANLAPDFGDFLEISPFFVATEVVL